MDDIVEPPFIVQGDCVRDNRGQLCRAFNHDYAKVIAQALIEKYGKTKTERADP